MYESFSLMPLIALKINIHVPLCSENCHNDLEATVTFCEAISGTIAMISASMHHNEQKSLKLHIAFLP